MFLKVPFQVADTEKNESAKKSKKVLSPLPAKICTDL